MARIGCRASPGQYPSPMPGASSMAQCANYFPSTRKGQAMTKLLKYDWIDMALLIAFGCSMFLLVLGAL